MGIATVAERCERMTDRIGQPRLGRRGDPPTAGQRFDRLVRPIGMQAGPQMADLGGRDAVPAINLPVDNQPAADPAANRHVKHDASPAAGAESRLGQAGQIAIVADRGGQIERALKPLDERKILPAFDLMAANDSSFG